MKKRAMLACSTTAGLLLANGSVSAEYIGEYHRRSIEGAWQVVTTLRLPAADCTTSPPVPTGVNPFASLNTFHEGGTMSEWGTRSPPALRTSGHGVWERIGHNTFGYRLMFYSFDVNGLLAATMDFTTELKLAKDGETFTGVSRIVRTDLSGNVLNVCATMDGRRFVL
jgi:hypothetical protein